MIGEQGVRTGWIYQSPILRQAAALLLWLLALLLPTMAHAGPDKRLVILDDDVSGLNGVALLLLQSPDVELLGITTTSGAVWRDTATNWALRSLEIVHRPDVPVVPGAVLPLLGSANMAQRAEARYSRIAWSGLPIDARSSIHQPAPDRAELPDLAIGNPTLRPRDEDAAAFLIRMVRAHPGQITVIAAGPMTNIAMALRLDPAFAAQVKEIVYLGGTLSPDPLDESLQWYWEDRRTASDRDLHIRWDPEAAKIVAHASWKKMTMIPADTSNGTRWTRAFLKTLKPAGTPLTYLIQKGPQSGTPMRDEIAAMVWLNPEIVTREERLSIDFRVSQTAADGDTPSSMVAYRSGPGEQGQRVILSVDRDKMEAAMRRLYMRPLTPMFSTVR